MALSHKEGTSQRRDIRQTRSDHPTRIKTRSKRARSFVIESRWLWPKPGKWRKHNDYRTRQEAENALDNLNHKMNGWVEYRLTERGI